MLLNHYNAFTHITKKVGFTLALEFVELFLIVIAKVFPLTVILDITHIWPKVESPVNPQATGTRVYLEEYIADKSIAIFLYEFIGIELKLGVV